MSDMNIKLEPRLVGDIKGKFFIPSYQRGYRWGKDEVTRLLDDITENGDKNYCLQPVVVKNLGDRFELIDGQQRLTTLYIILKFIQKNFKSRININFSLSYETREMSESFLQDIQEEKADENIDFFHICHAYKTIDEWFCAQKDQDLAADDIYRFLMRNVKVIWYEIPESADDDNSDAISLFTRLNIGKIPLTSAELVKAMFLRREIDKNAELEKEKQEEIALQWDNIERELHNESLWFFLTNSYTTKYQTRIDLILELLSKKSMNDKEKYATFFYFDDLKKSGENLKEIWKQIQHTFLILKDWYEDHELYHKLGYLIASGAESLQKLYNLSEMQITKSEFKEKINALIRDSITIDKNYIELSYENREDSSKIFRLLLLFNVISVLNNGEQTQWFPFDKFKYSNDGKVSWSLEHIHAQQSKGLITQEQWRQWLELHKISLNNLIDSENHAEDIPQLLEKIDNELKKKEIKNEDFIYLHDEVVKLLSKSLAEIHNISNLALLNCSANAALSNSTFDVKRTLIIDMDKTGQYIPFCTKMCFLKYYTTGMNQLMFWGAEDRKSYVNEINRVLYPDFLNEKIELQEEN
ncbi:MAG TPA: DUF262 domain-containing protein [Spirochaetota bacterium]|nr:DUF262 domain-containing protein [Spirochaetota bacterium]